MSSPHAPRWYTVLNLVFENTILKIRKVKLGESSRFGRIRVRCREYATGARKPFLDRLKFSTVSRPQGVDKGFSPRWTETTRELR